ncbi:RNA polymerase II transcription factor B subunit 1 [Apiospora kogelbergensis]|uniref:RNA polymerase II transcription factor B subunit 1 n=1 Tax=Apiospora kogelbergensis TaxID=1337665 RepID=A0AAW0R5Y9_9PEZI
MVAAAAPLLLFTDVANIQAAAAPPLLKALDKQNSDRYSAPTGVRNSSSTPEAVQAASSSAVCPEPTSHGAIPPKPENQTLPATPARLMNIDLNYESPLSRLELTPFRYGHGTELHPITEQRSIATLRNGIVSTSELETSRNRYNNNLSMSKHADENSHTQTTTTMFPIPRRRVRRQQSFSLDSGRTHLLGGGQDARKQQYQQILHRKETTSASSYSSVLGGGEESSPSTAPASSPSSSRIRTPLRTRRTSRSSRPRSTTSGSCRTRTRPPTCIANKRNDTQKQDQRSRARNWTGGTHATTPPAATGRDTPSCGGRRAFLRLPSRPRSPIAREDQDPSGNLPLGRRWPLCDVCQLHRH